MTDERVLPKSGGYRRLASFQVAQLIYDLTVVFVDRYIDIKSRTRDQMTQAARSGVQNIAEGSAASATSKKSEMLLTNVARASLEELMNDYMDFLRQNDMELLPSTDPLILEFRRLRIQTLEEFRNFVNQPERPEPFFHDYPSSYRAAQLIVTLINQAQYLLHCQLDRLQKDFLENGGVSERLYTMRKRHRSPSE